MSGVLTWLGVLGLFHIWAPLQLLIGAWWVLACWATSMLTARLRVRLTFPSPSSLTLIHLWRDVKALPFFVQKPNREDCDVAPRLIESRRQSWDVDVLSESVPGRGEGPGRETPGRDGDDNGEGERGDRGEQGGGGGGDEHQRLLLLEVDGQGQPQKVQTTLLAFNLAGDRIHHHQHHPDDHHCHLLHHHRHLLHHDHDDEHGSEGYNGLEAEAVDERRRDLRERRLLCTVRIFIVIVMMNKDDDDERSTYYRTFWGTGMSRCRDQSLYLSRNCLTGTV